MVGGLFVVIDVGSTMESFWEADERMAQVMQQAGY